MKIDQKTVEEIKQKESEKLKVLRIRNDDIDELLEEILRKG